MYTGYGAVSYTDPSQVQAVADSLTAMLAQSAGNQPSVVAQLQAMDAPTKTAVCAAMALSCMNQVDPVGCGQLVSQTCTAAQAAPTPGASTTGMISTTGAIVIGVVVALGLFWAIKK